MNKVPRIFLELIIIGTIGLLAVIVASFIIKFINNL